MITQIQSVAQLKNKNKSVYKRKGVVQEEFKCDNHLIWFSHLQHKPVIATMKFMASIWIGGVNNEYREAEEDVKGMRICS